MTDPEWRPVVGHEQHYEVSSDGQVRRTATGRTLVGQLLPTGHLRVKLTVASVSRWHLISRLVLRAFVGEPPAGYEACHGPNGVADNSIANLRWDTRSENMLDTVRDGTHPNARKTHCPKGHEYTPENTWASPNGRNRKCRACRRVSA